MIRLVSDSLIWEILRGAKFRFRTKAIDRNFCRNVNSTTGLRDLRVCSLGNSQYAMAPLISGKIYLSMKTAERAHLPGKTWQWIELPEDPEASDGNRSAKSSKLGASAPKLQQTKSRKRENHGITTVGGSED
jgi:hypothetical protein